MPLNERFARLLQNKVVNSCKVQNNVLPLRCLNKTTEKEQEMETMRVTDEERDLLEQMRNYNRSYPNGYPELLSIIIEKFYAMLRQPY